MKESTESHSVEHRLDDRDTKISIDLTEVVNAIKKGDFSLLSNPDVDNSKVALKMISDDISLFINNIDRFKELNKEIAILLIKNGDGYSVAKHLENFTGLELNKEIAMLFIENRDGYYVAEHPEKFTGLDKEIAMLLIENGYGDYVAEHPEKFTGLELNKEIAMLLIENRAGRYVAEHPEKFTGLELNKEIAMLLIENGYGDYVAEHPEKFTGLELNKEIAMLLIKNRAGRYVAKHLEKFTGLELNKEIAMLLIENGYSYYVEKHSEKFTGLELNKEIAMLLIENRAGRYVAKHLEKFTGLDKEIAMLLIEYRYGYCVTEHPEKFTGLELNKEIAMLLIENRAGSYVAEHPEKFTGLELNKEIAMRLVDSNQFVVLLEKINEFTGMDGDFLRYFINSRGGDFILANIDKFNNEIFFEALREIQNDDVYKVINFVNTTKQYKKLCIIYKIFPNIKNIEYEKLEQQYNLELKQLVDDNNYVTAFDLLELTELLNIKIDNNELVDKIKEKEKKARQEQKNIKERRELDKEKHIVIDEMFEFYLDHHIKQELIKIETVMKRNVSKLDFGHLRKLERYKQEFSVDESILRIKDWIKQYVIIAICSELHYASFDFDYLHVPNLDINKECNNNIGCIEKLFIRRATDEQIRIFLKQTSYMFYNNITDNKFNAGYGGKLWSEIAIASERLWIENQDTFLSIDKIFDIQHNYGYIFNMEKDRISANNDITRQFLDLKNTSTDMDDYFEKAIEYVSEDRRSEFEYKLKTVKQMIKYFDDLFARYSI